jgi:hypothetical protein
MHDCDYWTCCYLPMQPFKDAEPVTKFKVVDQYEGCQVIRYTDPSNRWNYLLKCT